MEMHYQDMWGHEPKGRSPNTIWRNAPSSGTVRRSSVEPGSRELEVVGVKGKC